MTSPACPACGAARDPRATRCSACGQTLPPPLPSIPMRQWLVFFVVLLFPAILTMLTAKTDELWPVATFGVGFLAALYCGFWLAWSIRCGTALRILLGVAFTAAFYGLSFALCCVGCAIGGVNLNIH